MLDIKNIRENEKAVRKNLARRKDKEILRKFDLLVDQDKKYRKLLSDVEKLRHKRNKKSLEVNQLKKQKKNFKKVIMEVKKLNKQLTTKERSLTKIKKDLNLNLMSLPNLLHEKVPYGKDETENKPIRKWGKPKKFSFKILNHAELGEKLNILDFNKSAEVSGKGFYYLKGDLALLNQALIRFTIDFMVKKNYFYIEPPLMLRRKPYRGVTDLEKFENVLYKIEDEDNFLISTSEHPLAAYHMNEILNGKDLPLKYASYTMCFRKEKGYHGIDTKGLFRTHQFNKVEQFIFCKPKDSWKYFEELAKNAESILQKLKIPYRIVNVCTGDIGVLPSKMYDIEAWSPRQKKYIEVGSCSNCTDYQARRLNIKYQEKGRTELLHTLNCTAIATSRILVAILENYQNKDGSITIPTVLQKYMNKKKISKN